MLHSKLLPTHSFLQVHLPVMIHLVSLVAAVVVSQSLVLHLLHLLSNINSHHLFSSSNNSNSNFSNNHQLQLLLQRMTHGMSLVTLHPQVSLGE